MVYTQFFAPGGRNDVTKLGIASMALEGKSIFKSVREFLSGDDVDVTIQKALQEYQDENRKVKELEDIM